MEEKMAKKIVHFSFYLAMVWIISASLLATYVNAQDEVPAPAQIQDEVPAPAQITEAPVINFKILTGLIIESLVFSVVGLVILIVGYKIFDIVTPYNLNKEIAENKNTAAGVAVAGILIALGIIVAAAIG
jgi:hypothetical protein